jgi:hypothetical protein
MKKLAFICFIFLTLSSCNMLFGPDGTTPYDFINNSSYTILVIPSVGSSWKSFSFGPGQTKRIRYKTDDPGYFDHDHQYDVKHDTSQEGKCIFTNMF